MLDSKFFNKKFIKVSLYWSMFLLLSFTIVTLSSYVTGIYGDDYGRVAKFVIKNELKDEDVILLNIQELDDNLEKEFEFSVSNYDLGGCSEISEGYTIKVSSIYNAIPFEYELYDKNDLNTNILDSNNETIEYIFPAGVNSLNNYILKVKLADDKYEYANFVDKIEIRLVVSQID